MRPLTLLFAAVAALATVAPAQLVEYDAPWMAYDTEVSHPGHPPLDATLTELNGDGYLDIATANNGGSVSVLIGDEYGRFKPAVKYAVSDSTSGIASADFDNDGDTDLAAAISGGGWSGTTVAILLNRGDGTFVSGGEFPSGRGPTRIVTADFNQDGKMDIAVAHDIWIGIGRSFAVLINEGNAVFAPPIITTTAGSTYDIATGDLNGDGRADLVVAGEMHDLSVVLNLPTGFAAPVKYLGTPVVQQDALPACEVADVDLDGDLDILYTSDWCGSGAFQGNTGHVGLRRNRGDGTFPTLETIDLVPNQHAGVGLSVADVTEDGWPDILCSQGERDWWSVVPGDGRGGFLAAQPHKSGYFLARVMTGDLDSDGDVDVASLARDSYSVAVHYNEGGGVFRASSFHDLLPPGLSPVSFSHTASGDLDRDGDLDVVLGYSANWSVNNWGFLVALNRGDGTFTPAKTYLAPEMALEIQLADLNRDGRLDITWIDNGYPSALRFRLGLGAGEFGPQRNGPSAACDPFGLLLRDVDNDGDLDALYAGCWNEIKISKWQNGSFANYRVHRIGGKASTLASEDLDGDGNVDLVTNTGPQQTVEVSMGNGDGTFRAPVPFISGFAVIEFAIADFDGDGLKDIASLGERSIALSVLIGRGFGLFKPPVNYVAGIATNMWVQPNYHALVTGDVDNDGDVDLLAPYYGSHDMGIWRNRGDGTFDQQVRLGIGERPWDVEFADFDGDGVEDVLVECERGLYSNVALTMLRGLGGDAWTNHGNALAGTHGVPNLAARSVLRPKLPFTLRVDNALENSIGVFILGNTVLNAPLFGGVMVPNPGVAVPAATDASGRAVLGATWPAGVPAGLSLVTQAWIVDSGAAFGFAATDGFSARTP